MVAALRQHCPELRFRVPPGGYYLWAALPAPLTTDELVPSAAEHGVTVRPGPQFAPDGGLDDHVRLCFAALEPRRIAEGIRRLASALAGARERLENRPRRAPLAAAAVV
jgi:DNA-binding transcriptional MocR family regulator